MIPWHSHKKSHWTEVSTKKVTLGSTWRSTPEGPVCMSSVFYEFYRQDKLGIMQGHRRQACYMPSLWKDFQKQQILSFTWWRIPSSVELLYIWITSWNIDRLPNWIQSTLKLHQFSCKPFYKWQQCSYSIRIRSNWWTSQWLIRYDLS